MAFGRLFSQQEASVEKSIFNVQIGTVGVWLNNELKLARSFTLRSEVGLEPSYFVGNGAVWHPNFRLEPRFYYNLGQREAQGKSIRNNSGNFFAVAMNYRPGTDLFSSGNIKGIESYSFVPKWGIRRSFARNFNYEAGFGFGLGHETTYGNYAEIDLHLRIGYTF
jgi:hypothetical protein